MPKIKPQLADTQIKNFKPTDKPYKKVDGGGLTLLIRPSGTKVWQYRYRLHAKENIYTIGQYPEIGAAEARTLRDQIRALVRKGIDPNVAKKEHRIENETRHERAFQYIADDWFDKQVWTKKHGKNIRAQFERDVYPAVGHYQIDKIKPLDVVAILKKIEGRGAPDVAKRTGQHMSAIYEYAINHGICEHNPAMGRSRIIKSNPVTHRAHLSEKQLPEFLKKLDGSFSQSNATEVPLKTDVITIRELAIYLKMADKTLYRLAAEGSVPGFKVGGAWRFRKSEIDRWIKAQEKTG